MASDILSRRPERMSAKKGGAAARFRPKLITVSANGPQLAPSGRSNTASRLHAEPVPSFPLRGRPPTERAGMLDQCSPVIVHEVRVSFSTRMFRAHRGQVHIEMPYVFLMYDRFHFWNTIPWSATFLLFQKRMESRQRKKMPPRHCGLKISPVTTLRATRSLRSLKQALRLTPPAKFSPFGHRPPFKGAGKLNQC